MNEITVFPSEYQICKTTDRIILGKKRFRYVRFQVELAMKPQKIVLSLLFIILGVTAVVFVVKSIPSKEEYRAREIIQNYMDTKGLKIKPGADEYKTFMRRIMWGEIPELTRLGSDFIKSSDELDYVFAYAWKYSGYRDLYGDYHDNIDLQEAIPPTPTNSSK